MGPMLTARDRFTKIASAVRKASFVDPLWGSRAAPMRMLAVFPHSGSAFDLLRPHGDDGSCRMKTGLTRTRAQAPHKPESPKMTTTDISTQAAVEAPVITEQHGETLLIRLKRPERRNALGLEMRAALERA